MNTKQSIKGFSDIVKNAIGDKAKLIQYELEKLGWCRRLRWVYQQGEMLDDRESIVERFLKWMTALKNANPQGFELLMFEIEIFLRGNQIAGIPAFEQRNPMRELIETAEIAIRNLKGLVKKR